MNQIIVCCYTLIFKTISKNNCGLFVLSIKSASCFVSQVACYKHVSLKMFTLFFFVKPVLK